MFCVSHTYCLVAIPLSLSVTVTVVDTCVTVCPPFVPNEIIGAVLSILFITKSTILLTFSASSVAFAYIVKLSVILSGIV
ncbi:hypothetical protein D3C73_865220 [compost metagenome]